MNYVLCPLCQIPLHNEFDGFITPEDRSYDGFCPHKVNLFSKEHLIPHYSRIRVNDWVESPVGGVNFITKFVETKFVEYRHAIHEPPYGFLWWEASQHIKVEIWEKNKSGVMGPRMEYLVDQTNVSWDEFLQMHSRYTKLKAFL